MLDKIEKFHSMGLSGFEFLHQGKGIDFLHLEVKPLKLIGRIRCTPAFGRTAEQFHGTYLYTSVTQQILKIQNTKSFGKT